MENIKIDFSKSCGKVKPMHAVNNGSEYKSLPDQRISNIDAFRDAQIPYARTHDASFYATYGGEHTVDVHAIFTDFGKDPYDPDSYDFAWTDEYLRVMNLAGVKPFYRLGSKIEHGVKKYGTVPPSDFKKWAVMCVSQYEELGLLMYYDARPCAMNGLFSIDIVCKRLKEYYPFYMFNKLYMLGNAVKAEATDESLYVCAAEGKGKFAAMFTYFDDEVCEGKKTVRISFDNVSHQEPLKLSYYTLDEKCDCELVREETVSGKNFSAYVDIPLYTAYLITAEKADE